MGKRPCWIVFEMWYGYGDKCRDGLRLHRNISISKDKDAEQYNHPRIWEVTKGLLSFLVNFSSSALFTPLMASPSSAIAQAYCLSARAMLRFMKSVLDCKCSRNIAIVIVAVCDEWYQTSHHVIGCRQHRHYRARAQLQLEPACPYLVRRCSSNIIPIHHGCSDTLSSSAYFFLQKTSEKSY